MKKKAFNIHFVRVGTDEQATEVIKLMAKRAVQECLDEHGAYCHNLDEVLECWI